jgi:hypothetical protein
VEITFPKDMAEEDCIAILKYEFDQAYWAALVFQGDEAYNLFISQGGRVSPGGDFHSAKALQKFVRNKAADRFPEHDPVIDTLDKLRSNPESLVPNCYDQAPDDARAGGKDKPECPDCPFRFKCGIAIVEIAPATKEESDEDLAARVREKMRKMYG